MKKLIILALGFLLSISAFAQGDLVEKKKIESKVKKEGWHPKLNLSGNISMNSSDHVIGQPNGDTMTLGLNIEGGLGHKRDRQEWRQSLTIKEATSRTPTVPRYSKSADEFKYETIYLYGLATYPWLGPYAKAGVQSSIFKGEDVRSGVVTYTGAGISQTGSTFRLTDPFRPVTTKESFGVFAMLKDKPKLKIEARLGLGAQQVKADDQYVVEKFDEASMTVNLKSLESYSQAGVEAGFTLSGKWDEKSSYSLMAEYFQPFNPQLDTGDDRKGVELLDTEITAKITSKTYNWMSLSVEGKYLRQPRLQKEEQKSVMLLLNFTHSIL